jgi:hypothetical protein
MPVSGGSPSDSLGWPGNCRNQVSMTDISVTTKHENVWRASAQWDSPLCDRARIMAMVWFVEPANQVELDAVGTAK